MTTTEVDEGPAAGPEQEAPELRLRRIVEAAARELASVGDTEASLRPREGAWSGKEVLGHLIDSALNNHPRFVNAAIDDDMVFAGYDQAAWVSVQHYRHRDWHGLLTTWRHLNLNLAATMSAIEPNRRTVARSRHTLHRIAWRPVPAGQSTTLEYLMVDYVAHLEHHLAQIRRALNGP